MLDYRLLHEYLWSLSHTSLAQKTVSTVATELITHYRIKTDITLIQTPLIEQPFVIGIKKIIVALPLKKYTQKELEFILKHEFAHIKHHDSLLKLFLEFLDVLYWWNPFLHKLIIEIHKLLEIRCDLFVSKNLPEQEKIDYLTLLLNESLSLKKDSQFHSLALTTKSKSFLIQRFNAILYHKTISNLYLISFSAIIIILAAILFLLQIILFFN